MTLGSCLLSNQVPGLSDALIQARIDGKSWQQIADEFDFGSPSGARAAFKKITGITDFKIKGKELKNIIDKGLVDDLKGTVPKKVKAPIPEPVQAQKVDDFMSGVKVGGTDPDVLDKIMNETFGHSKTYLPSDQFIDFDFGQFNYYNKKIKADADEVLDKIGLGKYNDLVSDLEGGAYYSNLATKYGMSFEDIDAVNMNRIRKNHVLNPGTGKVHSLWEIYKAKPTSENMFKIIEDYAWNFKKIGMSTSEIAKTSGIPENVLELIFKNKWSLPSKGSKEFVGYISPKLPSSSGYYSDPMANKTTHDLIGERGNFSQMTKHNADEWYGNLGQDLSPSEVSSIKAYTGSGYSGINDPLRGRNGRTMTTSAEKHARHISSSMRPVPQNVQVTRGVGGDTFPMGLPKPGDSFTDRGFLSTSFGGDAAFTGKQYELIIDVPAGARARPVHKISTQGGGEREILLDRDQSFIITGTKQKSSNRWEIYMRLII